MYTNGQQNCDTEGNCIALFQLNLPCVPLITLDMLSENLAEGLPKNLNIHNIKLVNVIYESLNSNQNLQICN